MATTGRSNFGYGRYGGGGYGGGGYGSLIAGQRAMYGTPVNFGAAMQKGLQFRDPRMAEKLLKAQLDLDETEKTITDNITKYHTLADIDMQTIREGDIEEVTAYLHATKGEFYDLTQQLAKADDPTQKAELTAKIKKLESSMTKNYADTLNLKEYQKLLSEGFSDFSKHNPEKYQQFLNFIDPANPITMGPDGVMVTGKDGKKMTVDEVIKLFPSQRPDVGIDANVTTLQGYVTNKVENNIVGDSREIYENYIKNINKVYDADLDDDNQEVLRGMVMGNVFGDHDVITMTEEEIFAEYGKTFDELTDGEKKGITTTEENTFLNSIRSEDIQKIWEGMGKSGSWINASAREHEELKKEAQGLGLKSLEDEFVSWMTDETVNQIDDADYVPEEITKDAAYLNAMARYRNSLKTDPLPAPAIEAIGLYNRIVSGTQLEIQNLGITEDDVKNNTNEFKQYAKNIQGVLNNLGDNSLNAKNFRIRTSENIMKQTLQEIDTEIYTNNKKWKLSEYGKTQVDGEKSDYTKWLEDNTIREYEKDKKTLFDGSAAKKAYVKEQLQKRFAGGGLFYSIDRTVGSGTNATTNVITRPFQGDIMNPDHLAKAIITIHDTGMLGYLPGGGSMSGVNPSPALAEFINKNPQVIKDIKDGKDIGNALWIELLKSAGVTF